LPTSGFASGKIGGGPRRRSIVGWAILIIASSVFRFALHQTESCRIIGVKLSDDSSGTGFQDAITPPWQTQLWLLALVSSIASIGYLFWAGGFGTGIKAIVTSLVVFFVVGAVLPKPESTFFVRQVYQSMVSRYANYRRDGDEIRGEAMKALVERFHARCADMLSKL